MGAKGSRDDPDEHEFAELKSFLGYFVDHYMDTSGLSSDLHPVAVLEHLLVRAPKKARSGLRLAINDCIEMTNSWPAARVAAVDAELRSKGLRTLSQLRWRYSTRLRSIVERGCIRTEVDYYLLRGAVEDTRLDADNAAAIRVLVEEFEARAAAKNRK